MTAQHIFVSFSTFLLVASYFVASTEIDLNDILIRNPRLVNLGGVGGKLYLMDNSTTRTWFNASKYADSLNMKLAEISNKEESSFLQNLSHSVLPFNVNYWTGGRDSLLASQFIWDTTGVNFSGHDMYFYGGSIIRSCVCLENDESRRALLANACTIEYFVLLQLSL